MKVVRTLPLVCSSTFHITEESKLNVLAASFLLLLLCRAGYDSHNTEVTKVCFSLAMLDIMSK